jgi:prepilin-type processing-associated H-X9-DG protein
MEISQAVHLESSGTTSMSTKSEFDPEFDLAIPKPSPGQRFGFVKLLLALGIIAFLIALYLPLHRGPARPAARRAQCTNNLKQIALALRNYEQTYNSLPPAHTVDSAGQPLHSWRTLILPFLEQDALYQTIDLTKPWNDQSNAKALATLVPVFRCPEAVEPKNTTTCLAVVSPNGCFLPQKSRRLSEITDPHDATLSVIEVSEDNAVPWMAPVDADESLVMSLGPTTKLHHAGGTNAAFVDGSVRFMKAGTPAQVRRALISIAGKDNQFANEW